MEKKLKIIGFISLILGIISISWLVYNFMAFEQIRPKVMEFKPLGIGEELVKYIFIGIIVSFFFHLVSFLSIIFQFQYFKKITVFTLITLFIGIISFICLVGDWAALSDIGKQYQMELSTNMEWNYLYLSLIFHVLFHILIITLLLSISRDLKNKYHPEFILKDEVIFNIAQYVGILCGFTGLCFTILILFMNIDLLILKYIIPFYCPFIIFPYCFILIYWLGIKRKEKFSDWSDEKQWQDIKQASLITILLSIPGMTILFFINYIVVNNPVSIIWFPYYLFMILLLFSGSTLYYNNKNV